MAVLQFLKNKAISFLSSDSVSVKEQLGYAGGIFGNSMGQDSVDTYDDIFCRQFMGIKNSHMTIKGNVSTILGFIAPGIAGALYDTPSRGKISNMRRALMFMPIPFALSSMLLFIVPTSNPTYNFIYALALSIVFFVVDAFYDVAMEALGLKICKDPSGRKNFYTISSLASTLGSMLPGWIIPIVVGTTDDATRQKWIYFFIALGFTILGTIAMYSPYMTIKERAEWNQAEYLETLAKEKKQEAEKNKVQWNKETFKALFHNRPFMVLLASLFLEMIRKITFKILPYLYDDVFDDYKMKSIIDAISGGLSYVGLFAVPIVGEKISARNILFGTHTYSAIFYLVMALFAIGKTADMSWVEGIRKKKWIIGMLIGFSGMPNAAQDAARKIIIADSTDYMEWYSYKHFDKGIRSDGVISAADSIVKRLTALLRTNIYNILFSIIKYKEKDLTTNKKQVQSPQTIKGIYLIAAVCGLLGNALAAIVFLFDNYTGKRKKEIVAELNAIRAEKEASQEVSEMAE